MRPKSIVLLLLALGCGLVASIGITQVIKRSPKEVMVREGMTPILVAMADLPMGEPINSANVKLEPWPQDSVPGGVMTKLSDIEGRRSRTEIFAGEPIIEKKLLPRGATTSTATEFIPKGYRVVAVEVDKSDGAGMIMPGDRVDVLLHVRRNKDLAIDADRTQTILQGIKVFAVDDVFKLDNKEKNDVTMAAKTISLLVTPQQAEKIDLGSQLGKIRLVMRGLADDQVVPSASISVADLLGFTEGANREKEEGASSEKHNLLELLSSNNLNKTPVRIEKTEPVKEEELRTWKMRVLEGGNVLDYKMKEVKESGVIHWQVEGEKEEDPGYALASSDVSAKLGGKTTQPGTEPVPQGGDQNHSGSKPVRGEPNKQKPESD
ncbi:MAG: Flp pilus assembly protein CpaB [Pirellulales bacterium]|nr:Flp pilus assembly protein CpaB [Pirellulales bacterium]